MVWQDPPSNVGSVLKESWAHLDIEVNVKRRQTCQGVVSVGSSTIDAACQILTHTSEWENATCVTCEWHSNIWRFWLVSQLSFSRTADTQKRLESLVMIQRDYVVVSNPELYNLNSCAGHKTSWSFWIMWVKTVGLIYFAPLQSCDGVIWTSSTAV